jgi:membrane fusion protein (multidrug efflux system)
VAPYESTDDAFIDGHIIAITPQVAAQVAAIHFDDNQTVHTGDLLVELDPTPFQVALEQARGAEAAAAGKLEQARAGVDAATSAVAEAEAALHSVQATAENAGQELARQEGVSARARSQKDLDAAIANRKTASAALERTAAQLQLARAQVASARANVIAAQGDYQKAQADTRRAEVNLGYCRIYAAADGRITGKAVDPGAYVTPANPLFQIVPIQVWVTANFKETQLKDMRPGQKVTVSVDAYPQLALTGRVDSIQSGTGSRFSVIPAENATGNFVKVVQRVPVKITLDGAASSLLAPGMSVEPKVRVRS